MHHIYSFLSDRLSSLADHLNDWSSRLHSRAADLYWEKHPEELEKMQASLARSRAFMEELLGDGALADTAEDLGHCTCPACRARTIN